MTQLEKMEDVIQEFRNLRTVQSAKKMAAMASVIEEYQEEKRFFYADKVDQFNLFQILGIHSYEIYHTRFLAWLLSCNSEHGQRDAFLQALLQASGVELRLHNESNYKVQSELYFQDAIIDIAIYRPGKFLIYLENKIFAGESELQLKREFEDMQGFGKAYAVPPDKRFAIFLTPEGRAGITAEGTKWYPLAYQDLLIPFTAIANSMPRGKAKFAITDWINNAKEWS